MTAVVLHYGAVEVTAGCLAQLAASDYPALELLVVNNAPGADWTAAAGRPVTVLGPPDNRGYASGNNLALDALTGGAARYALLCNNDARVAPDTVAALVRCADSDARIACVGARVCGAGAQLDHGALTFGPYMVRQAAAPAAAPVDCDWVSGCCLLVRLAAVEAIGGFDDAFFLYGEDVDWCLRARRAGWRVVHHPGATVHHDAAPGAGALTRRAYFLARNAILLARKHGTRAQRAATLAGCALLPALSLVRRAAAGEPLRPALWVWRGLLDGLRNRPPRLAALGLGPGLAASGGRR